MIPGARFWKGFKSDRLLSLLRVALGVAFVLGGLKLAMPTLFNIPDHETLARGFVDPGEGWISAFFAEKITAWSGLSIGSFLEIQGWVQIGIGLWMILGIFTPIVAVLMGLMFWSFAVANPVVGEIRMSRDLALMGLCFAVALSGASTWSLDRKWLGRRTAYHRRRDVILLLVRWSLAYPLIVSALFTGGALSNPLNSSLPLAMVLMFGMFLGAGIMPSWTMLFVLLWMVYLVTATALSEGFLLGLGVIRREVAMLFASLFYFLSGPDRWSWPGARMLMCRSVVDLVMSYLEGSLRPKEHRAFEAHIADCSNCWRFLKSYRYTVELGQELKEEDIPPDVHRRLEAFLRDRLPRP